MDPPTIPRLAPAAPAARIWFLPGAEASVKPPSARGGAVSGGDGATVPDGGEGSPASGDSGGPESLDRLVEENLGWLHGWVRGRVSDPEVVHDVCQDSFLKALRSMGALKDRRRFSSWLYRIARNTLHDHVRRTARRQRRLVYTDSLESVEGEAPAAGGSASGSLTAGDGAGARVSAREETERILAKVRALPARYREPLLLRYAEDLSYAEIGRILGISENAVQVRIFRGRKKLRALLGSQSERAEARGTGPGEAS